MAKIEKFEDIQAWQDARAIVKNIYAITLSEHFSRDFGLRGQIQRAAVSILSNIAEGFERGGNKEFMQFLAVAKASAGEVRSLLYIALDIAYIDTETFEYLKKELLAVSGKISGLMKYLKTCPFKGHKLS
jgi:four helix bundle protein